MHAGSQQVLTVFGGAFVAEQHVAEADRSLAQYEAAAGVAWLWLAFYVVIAVAALAHTGNVL